MVIFPIKASNKIRWGDGNLRVQSIIHYLNWNKNIFLDIICRLYYEDFFISTKKKKNRHFPCPPPAGQQPQPRPPLQISPRANTNATSLSPSLSLSSSVNKDELHLTDPKTKVQSPNKVVTPALVHWEREPMYLGIWRRPHLKPIFQCIQWGLKVF